MMKSLIILTSLLAVYACTTGTENGYNFLEPYESNKIITGMLQKTNTSHTLDDVRFKSNTGDNYFSFNLDEKGRIKELKIVDKTTGIENYQRYGDQNVFGIKNKTFYKYDPKNGDIVHLKDKYKGSSINKNSLKELKDALKNEVAKLRDNNEITHAEAINTTKLIEELNDKSIGMQTEKQIKEIEIASLSEDNLNLKYSDFGVITETIKRGSENFISKEYYSGGYNSKNIEKQKIKTNFEFKGKAIGLIQNKHISGKTDHLDLSDNNATFTFNPDKQTETLNMSFSNWYDVEVKKDNTNSNNIKFSQNGKNIDNKFKFNEEYKTNFIKQDENKDLTGKFDTNYYGDNNKPIEIVGSVSYGEDSGSNTKIFNAGFGANVK